MWVRILSQWDASRCNFRMESSYWWKGSARSLDWKAPRLVYHWLLLSLYMVPSLIGNILCFVPFVIIGLLFLLSYPFYHYFLIYRTSVCCFCYCNPKHTIKEFVSIWNTTLLSGWLYIFPVENKLITIPHHLYLLIVSVLL
jgi:hypothetical protein